MQSKIENKSNIFKSIKYQFKTILSTLKYHYNLGLKEKNFIVLNSIHKSGTTYFRLVLANYLKLYYDKKTTLITYRENVRRWGS